MKLKFNTVTRVYTENGNVDAEYATDVEFNNQGVSDVYVNGRRISAGDWWAINGFPGEQNTGKFKILFTGGTGELAVTQRNYTT